MQDKIKNWVCNRILRLFFKGYKVYLTLPVDDCTNVMVDIDLGHMARGDVKSFAVRFTEGGYRN